MSIIRYHSDMIGGQQVKYIVCDRCGEHYRPPTSESAQSIDFEYRVRYYNYSGNKYHTVTVDLCRNCQRDLDLFMKGQFPLHTDGDDEDA